MLGSDPGAAFTAIIQIGTELAVILYFRHDIINILTHWFSCLFGKNGKDWKARMGRGDNYATLGWNIIVGSIPIIILGFTLQNVIETSLRNLWITVTVLLVFGILLWMVDAKARQNKTMNDMTYRDAFLFGWASPWRSFLVCPAPAAPSPSVAHWATRVRPLCV